MSSDTLHYDLVIVGAGPAGLAAAIRFKQQCQGAKRDFSVAVLEKGAHVGAHILSGAVVEPRALDELLPDWRHQQPPVYTPVAADRFYYLTAQHALRLPTPSNMNNKGNIIISLGQYTRWLAGIAESMGVDILPGFAVTQLLSENDRITGVKTGDNGLDKQGQTTSRSEPGVEITAHLTLLAEGCRGQCTEQVIQRYSLRQACAPQTYGLGIKEIWQIPPAQHQPGLVLHSVGWPLDKQTYGGSFVYHIEENKVALGFVIGLDYQNPYLDPFKEAQRFKLHPFINSMLQGGERIAYGARALNEGGWQSIPQLTFPGGAIIGCAAGFMNVAKIKGSHTAMKSGMLAAECAFDSLMNNSDQALDQYQSILMQSWVGQELYRVRNVRPSFHRHTWLGLAYSAIDQVLLRGRAPWTWQHRADHKQLQPASTCKAPDYPQADGQITFDKLTSVALTGTRHREDEPCHLVLRDPELAIEVNWAQYKSPEQYYCPANVYEIIHGTNSEQPRLQINAANCIHCKTCDIKDPSQNIIWTAPEGGEGPLYADM